MQASRVKGKYCRPCIFACVSKNPIVLSPCMELNLSIIIQEVRNSVVPMWGSGITRADFFLGGGTRGCADFFKGSIDYSFQQTAYFKTGVSGAGMDFCQERGLCTPCSLLH